MASAGSMASSPRRGFVVTVVAACAALLARRLGASTPNQSISPQGTGTTRKPRRVVTSIDGQGRSRIQSDQPLVTGAVSADRPVSTDFWVVRRLPTSVTGPLEPTPDWKGGNQAPTGGVIGRLLTWPPGFSYPRHTTPSLDFIVILSGALELILDAESKVLNAGDVAIQRGTAHAWRVSGSEPCTFVGIMLDAQA